MVIGQEGASKLITSVNTSKQISCSNLKLDVLGPLVLQDRFPNKLLELAVVEDQQLGHDLLGHGRPEKKWRL